MAYNVPILTSGGGTVVAATLGAAVWTGAPTLGATSVANSLLTMRATAAGATAWGLIPVTGKIASITTRTILRDWTHPNPVAGCYMMGSTGKLMMFGRYGQGSNWCVRYDAGFAGGVAIFTEVDTLDGPIYQRLRTNGAGTEIEMSTDNVTYYSQGNVNHIGTVTEVGAFVVASAGLIIDASFDTVDGT